MDMLTLAERVVVVTSLEPSAIVDAYALTKVLTGTDAGKEIGGIAGIATGRAGTGQVVSSTGVRGLSEADLKAAKFDEAELRRAEALAREHSRLARTNLETSLKDRTLTRIPGASLIKFPEAI
jgi:hypothetical protein